MGDNEIIHVDPDVVTVVINIIKGFLVISQSTEAKNTLYLGLKLHSEKTRTLRYKKSTN